jgi:hypothetical protein
MLFWYYEKENLGKVMLVGKKSVQACGKSKNLLQFV